ncbi:MAG: type II secretion system protein [Fimbriimonadaceae bacterium]
MSSRLSRTQAVTLLEILVSIVIVSVLTGILVNVYRESHQDSQATVEISNLRQIGQAHAIYTDLYRSKPLGAEELVIADLIPSKMFYSPLDEYEEGVANAFTVALRKQGAEPFMPDWPSSYITLRTFGYDHGDLTELIEPYPNAGWLISTTESEASSVRRTWWGNYRRLTFDGAVIDKQARAFDIVEPSGNKAEARVPLTVFADQPDSWAIDYIGMDPF